MEEAAANHDTVEKDYKNSSESISDILIIEPLEEHIRRTEHLKALHKAFCIKHATQIRKRLFLAALNKGIK